jgi:hypothetical protein
MKFLVFFMGVIFFSFVKGQKEAGYATDCDGLVWTYYGQMSLSTAVKRNVVPAHAIKACGGVEV